MISSNIDREHLLLRIRRRAGRIGDRRRLLDDRLVEKDVHIGLRTDRLVDHARIFGWNDRLLCLLLCWGGRCRAGVRRHCWIGIKIVGILCDLYIGIIRRILIEDIRRIARTQTSVALVR